MPANAKHHITIENSDGEYGFITKQFSARQKPDTLFGSRFSTGDINYSTMSRWQRFAQTNWVGGAFQKYLEQLSKFKLSRNIDVLTSGEFKLSKALSSTPRYAGASPINKGIVYGGVIFWAEGQYVKYTDDDFATTATSKDFGSGKIVTDLEIYNGILYAAVGTHGLWWHDTGDLTTWAEQLDGAAHVSCEFLTAWGDNLHITYTNIVKYFNGTAFTTVKDFGVSGGNSIYFIKKPTPYGSQLLFPINVSNGLDGRGEGWYYNGSTFDIFYSGFDPIGQEIIVYDAVAIFAVYGLSKCSIKQYNGSTTQTLKSFDTLDGITIYGSSLTYGSGALYGAGSDRFSDPVHFAIWNDNLVIVMKRSSTQNTLILYDTIGWTEYVNLPTGADYYASLWLIDRMLHIGGSDGDIYRLEETFSATGYLQSSIWDADLQDINKLFADITIKHDPIETGDSIDVWYRPEGSGGFVLLDTIDTVGATKSIVSFPSGVNSVSSTNIEYKIVINSGDGTTSPLVKDVILRYILAPENDKRVFEYTVEATKLMRLLDDTVEPRTPAQIISNLWALKASGELLTLTDENGETHVVVFSDTTPEVVTPYAGDEEMEKYVYIRLFEL